VLAVGFRGSVLSGTSDRFGARRVACIARIERRLPVQ